MSNSPGPVPFFPHILMHFPSFVNFTMRLLLFPPCPSATKMSPFEPIATADGILNVSGPSPATPALPRVINTFPSGLNLKTCWPFPLAPCPSVTQMLPSLSTVIPWGNRNMPAPKLLSSLPDGSNSRMGARLEPAQVLAPHLSATHILPWRSTDTPAVDPQGLPSGSFAQFSMVRYGLGREFGTVSPWAYAFPPNAGIVITNIKTVARANVNPTRTLCGIM